MNSYKIRLALSIMLVVALLASCSSAKNSNDKTEPTQTKELAKLEPDTVRIISEEIDYFLNPELDEQVFQVMIAKGVKHSKKEIENQYVEENDYIYEFVSPLGKYNFVDVSNSGRKFLISVQANWADKDADDLSSIQSRLSALLRKLNQYETSQSVVKISNIEDFTELYVSYKDGKPIAYELYKWVD